MMYSKHSFSSIDECTFDRLLAQYDSIVPAKLADLEKQRLETIPQALRARDPILMKKAELVTLMDWKLAHGKFRPALKGYIQKNDGVAVEAITTMGFTAYKDGLLDPDGLHSTKGPARALQELTKLHGVGPATASLLLSTYDPENSPFFSDELLLWSVWEEGDPDKSNGRKIKYTAKEYEELCEKVQAFRARFKADFGRRLSAIDVEKVAYVIGNKHYHDENDGTTATKPGQKRKARATTEDLKRNAKQTAQPTEASNGTETRSKRKRTSK